MPLSAESIAVVTGASSGIGEACVRALRSHSVTVHALARRTHQLSARHGRVSVPIAGKPACTAHHRDQRGRIIGLQTALGDKVNGARSKPSIGISIQPVPDDAGRMAQMRPRALLGGGHDKRIGGRNRCLPQIGLT